MTLTHTAHSQSLVTDRDNDCDCERPAPALALFDEDETVIRLEVEHKVLIYRGCNIEIHKAESDTKTNRFCGDDAAIRKQTYFHPLCPKAIPTRSSTGYA